MLGKNIAFIGVSGCGKGTQIGILKKSLPVDLGRYFKDVVFTREPGGTLYAEEIRRQVKYMQLSPEREMELYGWARANSLANIVRPALNDGKLVISDRCFLCSIAYQGGGRELGLDLVWEENKKWVGDTVPDIVVFMSVDLETSLRRSFGDNPDKFDKEDPLFWIRTEEAYESAINWFENKYPASCVVRINDRRGNLSVDETSAIIRGNLMPKIESWKVNKEGTVLLERER